MSLLKYSLVVKDLLANSLTVTLRTDEVGPFFINEDEYQEDSNFLPYLHYLGAQQIT